MLGHICQNVYVKVKAHKSQDINSGGRLAKGVGGFFEVRVTVSGEEDGGEVGVRLCLDEK